MAGPAWRGPSRALGRGDLAPAAPEGADGEDSGAVRRSAFHAQAFRHLTFINSHFISHDRISTFRISFFLDFVRRGRLAGFGTAPHWAGVRSGTRAGRPIDPRVDTECPQAFLNIYKDFINRTCQWVSFKLKPRPQLQRIPAPAPACLDPTAPSLCTANRETARGRGGSQVCARFTSRGCLPCPRLWLRLVRHGPRADGAR